MTMVSAVPLAQAQLAGCHRGLGTILFGGEPAGGEWGQLGTLHGCQPQPQGRTPNVPLPRGADCGCTPVMVGVKGCPWAMKGKRVLAPRLGTVLEEHWWHGKGAGKSYRNGSWAGKAALLWETEPK